MEITLAAGSSPVAIVASIERLGGRSPLPVGIFLLDRVRHELHLRFREDWSMVADAEAVEMMEGLAELFIQRAREEGPTNLLHELLHQSSNYVRLGEPLTLPEPVDYKDELDRLYAENVALHRRESDDPATVCAEEKLTFSPVAEHCAFRS